MTPLTYQVGACRVHLISDGAYLTDGGGAFGLVPRLMWEKIIQPDPLNRILLELYCCVIETDEGPILVDTGHGTKLPQKRQQQFGLVKPPQLIEELAGLGLRPADIRFVINTHLHADHCGGNTRYDADGHPVPTFSRATYFVQRLELADAAYPNERTRNTYFPENFLPLADAGRLHVFSGDAQITPQVRVQVTPGHTRAHQVVVIESQGETAIFLGDAAGLAVYLERLAWVPAFDVEPLVSIETKRSLRAWAWRREALLLFQHDGALPAGRIAPGDNENAHWRVTPVATASSIQQE